jgi:SAM-dependent methyltransferase
VVGRRDHWEQVHRSKPATEVSWFQPAPEVSLSLIELAGIGPGSRVIDVGGGTSRLVDHLLDRGFADITILDISPAALDEGRRRLRGRAGAVTWVSADITAQRPDGLFDLWHDRAMFHFLTARGDRRAYVAAMNASLAPGAHILMATFALDGPPRCSGLDVVRYSPDTLRAALGSTLELVTSRSELHRTPSGREQSFVYCLFRRP